MRYIKILLGMSFVLSLAHPCLGTVMTYSFQGTVSSLPPGPSGNTPFGLTIPLSTTVTGQFAYDTTSTGTILSASATKYLQDQTDGFVAHFGSNEIRASDYLVTLSNNLASPNRDQIDISFRSTDSLLASKTLYVNNGAISTGTRLFIVSLAFPNTEWSGTSLPSDLEPSHLTPIASSSLLSDAAFPKVFFTIQSITLVPTQATSAPEPGSVALAIAALAGGWWVLRIYNRRRAS